MNHTLNRGVIIIPPKKEDYVAGEITKIVYREVNPTGDWTDYLPTEERQKFKFFDSFACVSFSAANSIETQLNYLLHNKLLSVAQTSFLQNSGFIDELGHINISDRYLAKSSGTLPTGNSLWAVANSLRHDGILPEKDWEDSETFNWDDYYAEIPQSLKDKAKEFYKYFAIEYEWIQKPDLVKHLKQAPIQIASNTCAGWFTDQVINKCDLPVTHATIIYGVGEYIKDFDSYPPYRLKLAVDYNIPYLLKIIIKNNTMRILGDIRNNKDQFLLGEDGKIRLIYNLETLQALHNAGVVNMELNVTWVDLSTYVRAEDIICVKPE